MSLHNIFNIIDIYGYNPELFIGGYSKYGTIVGVITTIITYLFLIFIFFYYLFQLFVQKSFITISSTRTAILNQDEIKMNKNNFYFAFALEDKFYNLYVDEQIYYPEIYFKRGIRNEQHQFDYSNAIKFDFGRCNSSYFGNNYENILKNYSLDNMYCIKDLNQEIYGTFSDNEYSFIVLKLYTCKNNSERNNCKSESEISDYLDGAIFTIQYQDYIFDPKNYSYPFKPIIGDFLTTVSQKYFKELYIYLKKYIFTSDNGLIFENKNETILSLFDYYNDLMSFQQKDFFFQLTFRMSPHVYEVSRSYTKAQTFICYIGGFITFVETMFVSLNGFLSKFLVYEKIINKIFFYKPDNIKYNKFRMNKNINASHFKLINKSNIKLIKKNLYLNDSSVKKNNSNNNKNMFSSEILLTDNKKPIDSEINIINNSKKYVKSKFYYNIYDRFSHRKSNKTNMIPNISSPKLIALNAFENLSNKYKIQLSYRKKLFYFCIKKNRKIYYYRKGIKIIKQKLDIISIIHDSFCLELVKLFCFEEQQKILLDYCFKNDLINYHYNKLKYELNNYEPNEDVSKSINKIFHQNINNDINDNSDNIDKNDEINQYLFNLYV